MGMYALMDAAPVEMTTKVGALVGEARRSLWVAWNRTTGPMAFTFQWSSNSEMGVVARGP